MIDLCNAVLKRGSAISYRVRPVENLVENRPEWPRFPAYAVDKSSRRSHVERRKRAVSRPESARPRVIHSLVHRGKCILESIVDVFHRRAPGRLPRMRLPQPPCTDGRPWDNCPAVGPPFGSAETRHASDADFCFAPSAALSARLLDPALEPPIRSCSCGELRRSD